MSQRGINTSVGFNKDEKGDSLGPEALAAAAARPANSAAAAADVGTSAPHKFFLPTKKTEEFVVVPPGAGISSVELASGVVPLTEELGKMGHPIVVHKPKDSEPEVFGATFAGALALICKDDAVPDALILLLGCFSEQTGGWGKPGRRPSRSPARCTGPTSWPRLRRSRGSARTTRKRRA